MSATALRKALKSVLRDDFLDGDVIRWTMNFGSNGSKGYNYAAIKANGRWYTTSSNGYAMAKILTFDELVKILASSATSNVAVAISWDTVR